MDPLQANYRRVISGKLEQRLSNLPTGSSFPYSPNFLEPHVELEVQELTIEGKYRRRTALEAYSLYTKTVFLGDAGSGKSTFLRRLALELARGGSLRIQPKEDASRLPVLIYLWKFARWRRDALARPIPAEDINLWNYILINSQQEVANDAANIVEDALKYDRATVLLDGLDEVPAEDVNSIYDAITNLTRRAGDDTRYVITCRRSSYREEAKLALGFLKYIECDLAPLDKAQIDEFVDLWEQRLRHTTAHPESLPLHELIGRPEVRRLAETPMLLSLICRLQYGQNVQLSKFQLFDNAIKELLWTHEKLKGDEVGDLPQISRLLVLDEKKTISAEELRACLEELSFKALEASDRIEGVVPQPMALEALMNLDPVQSKAWSRKLLDNLKLRTGLFLISPEVEGLQFSHFSFQEFMAGAHLARQKNFARTAINHLNKNRKFRETLLAAVSHLVHQQGELETPLFLAQALCEEVGGTWSNYWIAGDILLEMGTTRLKDIPMGNAAQRVVGERLATLVESGTLAPIDGARVGDMLGQLGDPRFASEPPHLPQQSKEDHEPSPGFFHVHSGAFFMGSRTDDSDARASEIGNSGDLIDIEYPFWISRFPVTVWRYQAFLDDRGYETQSLWSNAGWKWKNFGPEQSLTNDEKWMEQFFTKRPRTAPLDWEEQRRFKTRPVTGICWFEACAYAKWLEAKLQSSSTIPSGYEIRLPTEDEWEKSARGSDARRYPWGDEWILGRANSQESGISHPTPVGIYPLGASPSRVEEMAGNVRQWTLSRNSSYPYCSSDGRNRTDGETAKDLRIIRGGSFRLPSSDSRCATRRPELPHLFRDDLGFRVAMSITVNT